ncbi:hypothetical protein ABB07_26805 [Streptomyces incarnatus]|uniref:Tat pathway signal sequence domain protein n=2 Tax=Streptomyces incarnatus TaxID=665007 RepID=A0ABM5TRE4_9ACTN|nr:hypothetical protein ABB07_26805 [Streptomyces incarnatus]
MTSADGESHDMNEMTDMTHTDLALLLADAADEAEIGIAPVEAVIRRGRRRRARRWAVAAATTLVLAGSTGVTLAVTGLPGQTDRKPTVAAAPSSPEDRNVDIPQETELARGTDHGKSWRVVVSVWGAPRDESEAALQLAAMRKYGIEPALLPDHRHQHLVGMTSYYSGLYYGDNPLRPIIFDTLKGWEPLTGTSLASGALALGKANSGGPARLVVGQVPITARQVKCDWKDGTSTMVEPQAVAGSPVEWFACTAPEGTAYRNAEVIQ